MTNLKDLTVKALQEIAKEKGIALSYTQDGKRHRLNKGELISTIEATTQVEVTTIETTTETTTQITPTVEQADTVIEQLQLSEVIPFTLAKLKEINCKQELIELKTKLLKSFNDKQQTRKRTLKSKWATQYNRLTMLFRQAEMKLQ